MRSFTAVGEKAIGTTGFLLFADNLVRWWEGAEGSHWFWLLSGQIEAVLIFAGLSVADLFLYWSRIGHILDGSE